MLVNRRLRKVKLPHSENKKTFEAEVNGKPARVELSEGIIFDKPFFLKVGEKPYKVELAKHGNRLSTSITVDGVPYAIQFENKNNAPLHLPRPPSTVAYQKPVKTHVAEKGAIAASMPGKVVLVRVKAGDRVRAGDVLLVLESMKMENEIVSPVNGKIQEVEVSEGKAVNLGEILVVVSET